MEEIKTARLSSKRQISIPTAFTEFKEGEKLLLKGTGKEITITVMPEEEKESFSDLAIDAFNSWNSKEDEEAFAYLQEL